VTISGKINSQKFYENLGGRYERVADEQFRNGELPTAISPPCSRGAAERWLWVTPGF